MAKSRFSQLPNDTHPIIRKLQIEGYRRMTTQEKLHCVREMVQAGENLAMNDVRRRYPGSSELECKLRVASRYLDAELLRKAFGWDPKVKGY